MRPLLCFTAVLLCGLASLHAQDPTVERGDPVQGGKLARSIAGTYRHSFINGDMQGRHYRSTDTLTITAVGPASIQFDADLNFSNGHTCSLSGGALYRKDGTFVFDDDPANKVPDQPLCRLAIVPTATGIKFHDLTDGCLLYCGTRGSFNLAEFTFAQRVAARSAKQH